MTYTFKTEVFAQGNRFFAAVPFNVWETTGLKGNIPARVSIASETFECKLLPKGGGAYWIPVAKAVASALPQAAEHEVTLEPIQALSRINRDSPYSKERPVRRIDAVREITPGVGSCGQSCVAMLAGVELPEVMALMGRGHASWSKILEALDYYGISHADRAVYPRGRERILPPCCIVNCDNTFLLWYKGRFYGAAAADVSGIVCWIEVFVP